MAIKRYRANSDTTIVNAFEPNFVTRGTGSNMGMADVTEVFSVYGRVTSTSQELSRALYKFPTTTISSDRSAGTIPGSGSVSFYLRIFNAPHSKTVPRDYILVANPLGTDWQEGVGLDLETYKDVTNGNTGANWMSASSTTSWNSVSGGADWISSSADYRYQQTFETGLEDLEIDITPLVECWLASTISNYGLGVKLSSSYEAYGTASEGDEQSVQNNLDGATKSYYTKRLFARGTQYFFMRPVIEARWDSAVKDDRGEFYYSSSLATSQDNLNILYLYNYVRGRLIDIPGITNGDPIFVNLYSGSSSPAGEALYQASQSHNMSTTTPATGGWVSAGIYSCSLCQTAASTPLNPLYDVWYSGSTQYFTGTITPQILSVSQTISKPVYYLNITNVKTSYRSDETARFNLYVRNKFWEPTVYTVANTTVESTTINSASYRVYRVLDAYEAIPYGTSSDLSTLLSYDVSGNYFDFDMSNLEPGYEYAFKFAFYDTSLVSWAEQPEVFKFRVEDYEY